MLKRFDSLLQAGRFPEARRLCAGQMLRMFDFIALAQAKLAGYVDTARSREETLEVNSSGDWAYARISSRLVFTRPFLGQDSLVSVQAAHLYRSPRGWLLAEMEELEGRDSPVRPRSGIPDGLEGSINQPLAADRAGPARNLFPVSSRAPERAGQADRMRYRLRLKNGSALAESCPLGGGQRLIRALSPSEWIVEVGRRTDLRPESRSVRARASDGRPAPASKAALPDSTSLYLASNAYLRLEDTLLVQRAAELAPGETDPVRLTGAACAWVQGNFRFQLGSVLFGTSSATLRDLTGDCSEAAILTAALLRARAVPARIALGFASLGRGVFIGHAWCEAWLQGGWVGVDAALREFPAGAERVKLAELDGRGDMRIAATNLMMRMIATLEIEITGAWKNGKSLPLVRYPDNSAEAGRYFQDIMDGMERGGAAGK